MCEFCETFTSIKGIQYGKSAKLKKTANHTNMKDCQIIIDEDRNPSLVIFDTYGRGAFIEISNCPMCGRKLTGGDISMNKDEIFEETKSIFKKWEKEELTEYISAIITELLSNGVSIGECETTPPYIEYVADKGLLQREYANRGSMSIREQLTLNFAKHDEEVKESLMKELSENISSQNNTEVDDSDFYRQKFNKAESDCAKLEVACLDKDAEIEQLKSEIEGYKKVFENTREEINKKENDIFLLNECNGRLQAVADTYRNFVLPRATEKARKMIDNHRYSEVQIIAVEEGNKECDCKIEDQKKRIKELEEYVDSLKCSIDRKQETINQIDSIICEVFGIAHNGEIYTEEFKELLKEKSAVGKTVTDFIPTEPIKVAEMLINAEGEYENNPLEKALCKEDKGTYSIFNVGELRQIAEHLLVYCNANQ